MNDSARDLELKSSAVTLSDMEVFIFPELMYSLVLANIMSPRIWRWREDPWFDGLDRMKPYKRITRLKQFIMDHYIFNLDLDTWGLTTKERELGRFRAFIDEETLARSNALFGYEGDKYYFDIDIRKHFGLDKYGGDVIPYWKTETVEAMDAFRYRPNYESGAGECVSLATLYAAALFVVAGIPLEDIYLMATPLHSQNFVDVKEGILTNNRRLVTKNMWFNGTALSAQARRALENERVTIVTHPSGWIHTMYDEATIDGAVYGRFTDRLQRYLSTPLTAEILGNFLRQHGNLQKCFQFRFPKHGIDHYVAMERLFGYEHGSSYRVTDKTREKLVDEVEGEELMHAPLPERIVFNDVEAFVKEKRLDIHKPADVAVLKKHFEHECLDTCAALDGLIQFAHVVPRLPDAAQKRFRTPGTPLDLQLEMGREAIIERLLSIRDGNRVAELAFYSYRDLLRTDPGPFLKAAVERNPVAAEAAGDAGVDELVKRIEALANESVYDEPGRLAQPDEVWNFGRGDGAEKAILLATQLRARDASGEMRLELVSDEARLVAGGQTHAFPSQKGFSGQSWPIPQHL